MKDKKFAVIGLGRFGSSVAKTLLQLGHDVLAVDNDVDRIKKFSDCADLHIVQANTTNESSLKELGIHKFDVVIVAIGYDVQASILTTILLKELGVPHVVAKAQNIRHGQMLEKVGADRIVYPEQDMGQRVAHNLISDNVLNYMELSSTFGLAEIIAPAVFVGKTLVQLRLSEKYKVNIVAIKRGESLLIPPRPEERLMAQDKLITIGNNAGLVQIEELH